MADSSGSRSLSSTSSATGTAGPVVSSPRYIPLPDCMYRLRRRFPSVLLSVPLECTRCRRWVAVDVLDRIPDEVPSVAVCVTSTGGVGGGSSSSTGAFSGREQGHDRTAGGTDDGSHDGSPSSSPAAAGRVGLPVKGLCAEEDTVAGASLTLPRDPNERVRRYLADTAQARARAQRRAARHLWPSVDDSGNTDDPSPTSPAGGGGGGSRGRSAHLLTSMERILSTAVAGTRHRRRGKDADGRGAAHRRRYFIPNPAVYTCPWDLCQQADVLLDLRTSWLGDIYAAALKCEAIPPAHPGHRQRPHSADPAPTPGAVTGAVEVSAHLWSHRHAINEALGREVAMRYNGRLAAERHQNDSRREGEGDGSGWWSALERHLGEDHKTTHGNGHGGGGPSRGLQKTFLNRAAHALLNGHDTATAHDGGFTPTERKLLSAFCWVTCEACGKLRRVTQPFPGGGGSPFVCALAGTIESCDVPEDVGVFRSTAAGMASEAEMAVMYMASQQLPDPLNEHCHRALHGGSGGGVVGGSSSSSRPEAETAAAIVHDDPLLRLVHTDAARRAFGYTSTALKASARGRAASSSSSLSSGAIAAEVFPPLRELAALVRKRALGAFVKQLTLTQQEVRAKREEVLRSYLCDDDKEDAVTGTASSRQANAAGAEPVDTDGSSGGTARRQTPQQQQQQRRGGRREAAPPLPDAEEDADDEGESGGTAARRPRRGPGRPRMVRAEDSAEEVVAEKPKRRRTAHASATVPTASGAVAGSGDDEPRERRRGRRRASPLTESDTDEASRRSSSGEGEQPPRRARRRRTETHVEEDAKRHRSVPSQSPAADEHSGRQRRRRSPAVDDSAFTAVAADRPRRRSTHSSTSDPQPLPPPPPHPAPPQQPSRSRPTQPVAPSAAPPVRRGPGRPRKNPLPADAAAVAGTRPAPSNTGTSASRAKSSQHRSGAGRHERERSGRDAVSAVDVDTVFWVQCDRCDKWRIVPERLPDRVKFWECRMRPNTTCADIDDAEAEEVE